MYGSAGTGKTFIGIYLALQEILHPMRSYTLLDPLFLIEK